MYRISKNASQTVPNGGFTYNPTYQVKVAILLSTIVILSVAEIENVNCCVGDTNR